MIILELQVLSSCIAAICAKTLKPNAGFYHTVNQTDGQSATSTHLPSMTTGAKATVA